jgi:type VI secretion system protein ImpF
VLRTAESPIRTLLTFDIAAEMWAEPMPLELYLRSEVDVTTGQLHLEWAG